MIGAAHKGQVCSTWGNFHFYTFDGDFFQLPYSCNYILATMCQSTESDFNIQLRREYINGLPAITSFTIKLEGMVLMLHQGKITMGDKAWVFCHCNTILTQFKLLINSKLYCLYVMVEFFSTNIFKQVGHPRLL